MICRFGSRPVEWLSLPGLRSKAHPFAARAVCRQRLTLGSFHNHGPEPWAEALSTSEGPLLLDLHDLGLPTVGEGDLRVTAKTSNPDTWMVLQELTVAPFPWPR